MKRKKQSRLGCHIKLLRERCNRTSRNGTQNIYFQQITYASDAGLDKKYNKQSPPLNHRETFTSEKLSLNNVNYVPHKAKDLGLTLSPLLYYKWSRLSDLN